MIKAIDNINLSYYNKPKIKKSSSKSNYQLRSCGYNFFPKNYYINQISFEGGKKLNGNDIIERVGAENFPSNHIVETLRSYGNDSNISLYEIHIDYFKDLLNCKTLDEAKEKYPEFKDVIDAKDLDIKSFDTKSRIRQIAQGEVKGADIETLSLELLKKFYGNFYAPGQSEHYYDISKKTIYSILELLNIKRPTNAYIRIMNLSKPEVKEKISSARKALWANDDGTLRNALNKTLFNSAVQKKRIEILKSEEHRQKCSEIAKNRWLNDDGTMREKAAQNAKQNLDTKEVKEKRIATQQSEKYRKRHSEIIKQAWKNDNGTMYKAASKTAREILHNEENTQKRLEALRDEDYRKRLSESLKEFNRQNPEYTLAHKEAWKRHPEITKAMSDIASEYPGLSAVISKKEHGETLSEAEEKYLRLYFKDCDEKIHNHHKIIGQEFHNILVEWGIIEE